MLPGKERMSFSADYNSVSIIPALNSAQDDLGFAMGADAVVTRFKYDMLLVLRSVKDLVMFKYGYKMRELATLESILEVIRDSVSTSKLSPTCDKIYASMIFDLCLLLKISKYPFVHDLLMIKLQLDSIVGNSHGAIKNDGIPSMYTVEFKQPIDVKVGRKEIIRKFVNGEATSETVLSVSMISTGDTSEAFVNWKLRAHKIFTARSISLKDRIRIMSYLTFTFWLVIGAFGVTQMVTKVFL